MPDHRRLVRFLAACYEADNRESGVMSLLADEVRHLMVPLRAAEVLTGDLDRTPVEREAALAAARDASLYAAEKRLLLGAFVLLGRSRDEHRSRLCAPLYLAPATVVDAPPYAFVAVDLEQARLNTRALARLAGESSECGLADLEGRLPSLPLPPGRVGELVTALAAVLPGLDTSALAAYPRLLDEAELRAEGTSRRERARLLPAAAVALLPTSPETREVLAELGSLADAPALSPPLQALLGLGSPPPSGRHRPGPLPASLSFPQQRILASAATAPLTVVVGPPGTGKSYTLAALALEHAARGEPVLVAARTEQALDVLAAKLDEVAGGALRLPRGGRGGRLKQLRSDLDALLQGLSGETPPVPATEVRRLERRSRELAAHTAGLETALARRARLERSWGELEARTRAAVGLPGLLLRQRLGLLSWRLGRATPLWRLATELEHAAAESRQATGAHLRALLAHRLEQALTRGRADLVRLARALAARTKLRMAEHFASIDRAALLGAFPIWLTTLADVGELLPCEREMFALAVVDETTQADMASVLPVLQRARRAVLTGDPRQLRHVSFLSDSRLAALAERHGVAGEELERLHFRSRSALDLALDSVASQQQVLALDEHFRSRPAIIEFSNRELYGSRLRVMSRRPATVRERSLELRRVTGRREGSGANPAEAEALLAELLGWVEAERALPAGVCHSIGVLSPFRDQVDHLARRVAAALDVATIARHGVRLGTAHAFQGEERDIMLLSLAVDADTPAGATHFLNRPDVLNVSITRARQLQVVFTSLPEGVAVPGLLGRYLQHVAAQRCPEVPGDGGSERLLAEVAGALRAAGCAVWPRYRVAGHEVDLVAERTGATAGVDLVGQEGPLGEALGPERLRVLERAGLPVVPLPLSAWRRDREACLQAVLARLSPAAPGA